MTPTTAADKVKEIYWNIIQHWCGGPAEYDDPIVSKRFNEWLASSSGSLLVGELVEDDKLQEAVTLLQKMVTDTNPEQVMETYESIHVFLNSINQ